MTWPVDTPGGSNRGRSDSIVAQGDRSTEPPKEEKAQDGQLDSLPPQITAPNAQDTDGAQESHADKGYSCDKNQPEFTSTSNVPARVLNPRNTGRTTPIQRSNSTKSRVPALEPPVTKSTLSELDVNKIVHNPKLRHDINFDPELHFRPNLDGEKGRMKTQKANDFWQRMCQQLEVFLTDRAAFDASVGNGDWCLPSTLRAIRGILETLVPARDRASVEEFFNVSMLMQQFTMGVADLGKLAAWLSQLLKSHCAPMRDEWVDEMVGQLSSGDRDRSIPQLVGGMRTLLGVLEAMKLVSLPLRIFMQD
jgi:hypothetical protein